MSDGIIPAAAKFAEGIALLHSRAQLAERPVLMLVVILPDGRQACVEVQLHPSEWTLTEREFCERFLLPAVASLQHRTGGGPTHEG